MFKVKIVYFEKKEKSESEVVVFNGIVDVEGYNTARRNCISYAVTADKDCKNFVVESVTDNVNIVQEVLEQSNTVLYYHIDSMDKIHKDYGIRIEMRKLESKNSEFHAFTDHPNVVDAEDIGVGEYVEEATVEE